MFIGVYYFNVKQELSECVSVCVIHVPCLVRVVIVLIVGLLLVLSWRNFNITFRQKTYSCKREGKELNSSSSSLCTTDPYKELCIV